MSDLAMGMEPMGVGVVGYGFIGKVHTWAHQSIPFFFDPTPIKTRLVAVCTQSERTAQKAKEQGGFEFGTTNFDDVLARPDIGIIHICSPNDAHHDVIRAALRAGKHIYCDKPLTRTVEEAEEIAALAERTPASVCRMTFNYRFAAATLRAKELCDAGFLGDIYQFRAAYLHAGYVDKNRPRTWRTQMAKSGGGAIMDLGTHAFDLMRHLIGDFEQVSATLQTRIPLRPDPTTGQPAPVDVDDIAVVQCKLKNGAIGVLEASRLATGVQDELRFEIHGSLGALSWSLMEPNFLTVYDARVGEGTYGGERGPQKIECVARYPKPYAFGATKNPLGWPQLHIHCLHDFLQAVAQGDTKSGPNFDDGLKAQQFVHACQRSAANDGKWTAVTVR